jgi:threonine 3-dehydrogenase
MCPSMRLLGYDYPGAFAEFVVLPQAAVRQAIGMSFRVAAILDPIGNAVHAVSKARVSNERVLVAGCGPIGLMVVRLLRYFGARQIVASEVSEYRRELARRLGADLVVDPSAPEAEDLVAAVVPDGVDVFFEMSGTVGGLSFGLDRLRPGGVAVVLGLPKTPVVVDVANQLVGKELTIQGVVGRELYRTWRDVYALLGVPRAAQAVRFEAIITHEMSMTDYREAFRLMSLGQCGKILLYPNSAGLPGDADRG